MDGPWMERAECDTGRLHKPPAERMSTIKLSVCVCVFACEKKEYKHSNTCASGMLCSQEHGHASTFNMLTQMHKATWGLFPRTVCKAVHPYCRRREGRREAEMDYLVGQHAEERVWSDMPSSQLLSRKCKSKLHSWSFSILVCIHLFFYMMWKSRGKKKTKT